LVDSGKGSGRAQPDRLGATYFAAFTNSVV
jgi:hypothetical protein